MQPRRRVPLRATCDRCSRLRKKCDSMKPWCSRCQRANSSCVYSPLRRPCRALGGTSQSPLL
ncbi:unnamed protein product, partial [Phaeothamnion confervicola]